ncbi:hypothetical protein SESBI_06529 [Sesbania bispinosa]|nr:hypothetical protein SESBI_06529 [Sesbania bispinosa]
MDIDSLLQVMQSSFMTLTTPSLGSQMDDDGFVMDDAGFIDGHHNRRRMLKLHC